MFSYHLHTIPPFYTPFFSFFLQNRTLYVRKEVNQRFLKIFNMIRLVAGTNGSLTKGLMFQVFFFFIISCKNLCKNQFNLFSYFFIISQKWKWRVLSSLSLQEVMKKKKYAWNIRLVCPINPASQRIEDCRIFNLDLCLYICLVLWPIFLVSFCRMLYLVRLVRTSK